MAFVPPNGAHPGSVAGAATEQAGLDGWIAIKMDDRVFTVMRTTLLSVKDSMFSMLFECTSDSNDDEGGHRHLPYAVMRDPTHPLHPYIFDRNPRYFEPVLNYLRTGQVIIDPSVNIEGVYIEAQYFNITPLVEELTPLSSGRGQFAAQGFSCTREELESRLAALPDNQGRLRLQGMHFAGFDFSNMDLSRVNLSKCNLKGANFRGARLTEADLSDSVAEGADFSGVEAEKTIFSRANLCDAVFEGAHCAHAKFCTAKCHRAKFIASILSNSNLSGADLTNANLTGSRLEGALLTGVNLSGVERQGTNLTMGGVMA